MRVYELERSLIAEAQVRTVKEFVDSLNDDDIAALKTDAEFKKQNVLLIRKLMQLQDEIRE
jgi:hypothetical protein